MRLFGSFLVLAEVSFFFMPFMRAQKDLRLAAFFGLFLASFAETGRLMFFPCLRNERLPASLRPPSGFCPSFRVHAGVFFALGAIMSSHMLASYRHLKDWFDVYEQQP